MESVLTYQSDVMTGGSLLLREPQTDTGYFDEAVELLIAKLQDIQRRSADPNEDPSQLMGETTRAILEMSFVCERFEREHRGDREIIRTAQNDFRARTDALLRKSYFMDRARTWPQGYPGDYKTIEGFYKNIPLSEGLGYYLDKHFLSTTLAIAVRERKRTLAELIAKELVARTGPKILDIACGSCRELFELAPSLKAADATVTCIDFDGEALDFSAARMSHAGIADDHMIYRKYNALKMISHERNLKEFGLQDMIYSVGFFDYLDDEVLARLLNSLYRLLKPEGTLVASFKDTRRYRAQEYHWFVVWDGFFQRTVEDMWALLDRADIPRSAVTMSRERSGVIVFFTMTR